jgi:hypothetical protein
MAAGPSQQWWKLSIWALGTLATSEAGLAVDHWRVEVDCSTELDIAGRFLPFGRVLKTSASGLDTLGLFRSRIRASNSYLSALAQRRR